MLNSLVLQKLPNSKVITAVRSSLVWKLSNLLAHPDWANDHKPVKISLCKYVLQLINRHHWEWTVLPSYLIDTSLGTSTPSIVVYTFKYTLELYQCNQIGRFIGLCATF